MQQATARSASVEQKIDRPLASAEVIPITLGIERTTSPRRHGSFRELILSIVSANAPAQPAPVQTSAEATLLLTEADFAPPEAVLPIVARVAALAACAIGAGAVVYFALALIT